MVEDGGGRGTGRAVSKKTFSSTSTLPRNSQKINVQEATHKKVITFIFSRARERQSGELLDNSDVRLLLELSIFA